MDIQDKKKNMIFFNFYFKNIKIQFKIITKTDLIYAAIFLFLTKLVSIFIVSIYSILK